MLYLFYVERQQEQKKRDEAKKKMKKVAEEVKKMPIEHTPKEIVRQSHENFEMLKKTTEDCKIQTPQIPPRLIAQNQPDKTSVFTQMVEVGLSPISKIFSGLTGTNDQPPHKQDDIRNQENEQTENLPKPSSVKSSVQKDGNDDLAMIDEVSEENTNKNLLASQNIKNSQQDQKCHEGRFLKPEDSVSSQSYLSKRQSDSQPIRKSKVFDIGQNPNRISAMKRSMTHSIDDFSRNMAIRPVDSIRLMRQKSQAKNR